MSIIPRSTAGRSGLQPLLEKAFRRHKRPVGGSWRMDMIRKGQLLLQGCSELSFTDQFDALAVQVRPA